MRMSLTTTCGVEAPSALSASCAEANILKLMSSRASVFSNTQRMERSSSMIQTGFMCSSKLTVLRGRSRSIARLKGSTMVKQVCPGSLSSSITPWCWR